MSIQITHSTDLKQLIRNISTDKILRVACLDSVALISNRIQNKGLNSEEKKIKNKSPQKAQSGAYSDFYSKVREDAGRQTSFVDLTFTGETLDNLGFEKTGENEYVVGFSNTEAAQKAEWNEAQFGEVYSLSNGEVKLVTQSIEAATRDAIGG